MYLDHAWMRYGILVFSASPYICRLINSKGKGDLTI